MKAVQLELDFKQAIALALDEPARADLQHLWNSFEPELVGLTQKEQLQRAGQALCDLAEVCQRRAELMWNEWQDSHNVEGPIPDEDFLAGLVQKTMFLDISELVRQLKSRKKAVSGGEGRGDSVVEEVTKETALLLAGADEDDEPEQTFVLQGYDENIAAWAAAIRCWLEQQGLEKVSFLELMAGVGFPVVKTWLAVLLHEKIFVVDRLEGSEFYDGAGILIEVNH
jgi:hypothetical protein